MEKEPGRETKRQRRERLKVENPTPKATKGGLRLNPRIVGFVSAAFLLAAGIGVAYVIDQDSPYNLSHQEAEALVVKTASKKAAFDPSEKSLWEKTDREAFNINVDSAQEYVGNRLNAVKRSMFSSHNSDFTSTVKYFDDLANQGQLEFQPLNVIASAESANAYYLMTTSATVKDGNLKITLNIFAPALQKTSSVETAMALTHEGEHMRQMKRLDDSNLHLTDAERSKILDAPVDTKEKLLNDETNPYKVELQAFIKTVGLIGISIRDNHRVDFAAQLIKANFNPRNSKFLAYLYKVHLGKK